jgi:hypothetical protein
VYAYPTGARMSGDSGSSGELAGTMVPGHGHGMEAVESRPRGGLIPRRLRRLSPAALVMIAATALGLGLRAFVLARPNLLTSGTVEYDDGVYLGAAVRVLQGALPYKDFAFIQPPGILIVSLPAALVASVTTTSTGLVLVRVLTVVASAACIPLAGNLVRYRGALVTAVACGILAVYPADVITARTLLLEPWMNLCCLLAANAAFRQGRLASPRRLAWAGLAFGFATAIKFWAAVPAVLLLAACLLVSDQRVRRTKSYVAGLVAGFVVPVAPFALQAPLTFIRSTLFDQAARAGSPVPVSVRLAYLSGLIDVLNRHGRFTLTGSAGSLFAMAGDATTVSVRAGRLPLAAAALVIAVLAVAYFRAPRARSQLEWLVLAVAVVSSAAVLGYSAFFYHYPAFPAPWLALAVAAAVWALAGRTAVVRRIIAAAAAVVILAVAAQQAGEIARMRVPAGASVSAMIPAGACVVTDQVSYTIAADRFTAARPGCPDIVDSLAATLVISHGVSVQGGAARLGSEETAWRSALGKAQYAWFSAGNRQRIPWSAGLRSVFTRDFRLVGPVDGYPGSKLYVRRS